MERFFIMSLVWILKDRRRMLGLSQAQVAKRAGISIPTLRELETSQGTIRSLTAVLAVLDLRWAWAQAPRVLLRRFVNAANFSRFRRPNWPAALVSAVSQSLILKRPSWVAFRRC
ncbi:helix-turn-helix domain-containing protein [Thioclava sp. 15-R06ZXC-3]|uniref:Helix-turn-helix domain-containing protein n=1 Tax=Thioclava arctica TaxID=3238301 RepID=A0ABV3TS92_9RHOB